MENQNKFKALDIDFSIPDELQSSIDKYIDYLNTETNSKYLLEDCYQTEILMEINECIREDLLDSDNIALLKNYYIKRHNIGKNYIIIDDDESLFPDKDRINLYITNHLTGLTNEDVSKIRKEIKRYE